MRIDGCVTTFAMWLQSRSGTQFLREWRAGRATNCQAECPEQTFRKDPRPVSRNGRAVGLLSLDPRLRGDSRARGPGAQVGARTPTHRATGELATPAFAQTQRY